MKKVFSWIKEILVIVIIVAVLSNVISFLKKPDLKLNTLPNLNLITTTQKEISTKDYKNKPILLHFWALWCPTCKLEISNIQNLSNSYHVITVAVNSGDDKDINSYLKQNNLNFDVINDNDGKFASKFSISSFPTTFIYDKDGKIKFSEVGYTSTLGLKLRMWLSE